MKKAATWNTAVPCGATSEISYLNGQAARSAPTVIDESRGIAFSKDGTAGELACTATYNCNLRYAGLDLLIAMFMGIAGVPTQQGATAAYKNIYKWNPDVYGLFLSIVEHRINYIGEVPTAKVAGLTITGEVGPKPLQASFEFVGSNLEINSAVNTLATYNNVTMPSGADRNPVMFSHLGFRMNDQGGAALGAGDAIYPSKFTLAMKRKVKGEYTGQYRTSGSSPQDLIDEPTNDGLPEMKLILEFPTHTGNTYLQALGNDTRKKADIIATGGQIAAPYNYQHMQQFPHLQLINDNPTDDNGRIKEPLEFMIHGAAAAPNGMAGITDPLWWTVINTLIADPLA